jgi:photosystem II stability/assembly factor-like uncharacterized protein
MDFVNVNTGWVFGVAGSIYKTTNGGLDWENQPSGVTNQLRGACFLNANTGWYVVGPFGPLQSFMVRKTTDGGITWIGQNANTGNSALFDIKMLDENTGYLGDIMFSENNERWSKLGYCSASTNYLSN